MLQEAITLFGQGVHLKQHADTLSRYSGSAESLRTNVQAGLMPTRAGNNNFSRPSRNSATPLLSSQELDLQHVDGDPTSHCKRDARLSSLGVLARTWPCIGYHEYFNSARK